MTRQKQTLNIPWLGKTQMTCKYAAGAKTCVLKNCHRQPEPQAGGLPGNKKQAGKAFETVLYNDECLSSRRGELCQGQDFMKFSR